MLQDLLESDKSFYDWIILSSLFFPCSLLTVIGAHLESQDLVHLFSKQDLLYLVLLVSRLLQFS